MPAHAKVINGKCARCAPLRAYADGGRSPRHCGVCVCCTQPDTLAGYVQGTGRTRVFAFVRTTDPRDAHTLHYVRRSATSRIPDGGKVALQWRDRTLRVAPLRGGTGNRRALDAQVAYATRLPLQSRARG